DRLHRVGSRSQRRRTATARARLRLRHRPDSAELSARRHVRPLSAEDSHMTNYMKMVRLVAAIPPAIVLSACSLDIKNPNAPTADAVLTSSAGLRTVAIGLQGRLDNSMEEAIIVPGIVSGEIGNTNATQSTQR